MEQKSQQSIEKKKKKTLIYIDNCDMRQKGAYKI